MRLPGILVLDWERKLAALVFAVLIWWSVRLQISDDKEVRDIPLTVVLGESLALVDEGELPRLSVFIKGSQQGVKSVGSGDISVTYTLPAGVRAGPHEVHLRARDVKVPRNLRVSEIKPETFTVMLVNVITRDDVDVRLRIQPPKSPNIRPKTQVVTPRKVTISGPRNLVESINEITTEPLPLEEIIQPMDFEQDLKLTPQPRVKITPNTVRVHVELIRVRTDKAFLGLPLQVLYGAGGGLRVESFQEPTKPLVDATIEGPPEVLDFLTAASVRAFIDLSELPGAGIYQLPVHLWINAKDCTRLSCSPRLVTVKVARQQVSPAPKP